MFKLTPKISVKATSPTGARVNTTIEMTHSQYINGIFANVAALPVVETNATAVAAPFKLPGTRIEIVPVGLYFFSAYMIVFCTILGWGTMERAKFRDQYRKRVATSGYR